MRNNILVIILVIIVGMVAFWYLGKNNNNVSTSSITADTATSNSADAKYIYNILQEMAQVNLDDSIFSNPVFQSLKDNTISFAPQAAGRNNPFSPVGTDLGTVGQTTQSQ